MALEEDQLLYQALYVDKDDTYINYDKLLNTYSMYLSFFVSQVPGYTENYMNLTYLSHVVNGFEYYQDDIFETGYLEDDVISSYILYKFGMLQQQGPIEYKQLPIQDLIFKITGACQQEIERYGLSSFAEPIVRKMYSNCCKIDSVLDKYSKNYKGM